MPVFKEPCQQISPEVMRLRRQSALIAKMVTMEPTPEIEPTKWDFDIAPEQLESFLAALNDELSADNLFPEGA